MGLSALFSKVFKITEAKCLEAPIRDDDDENDMDQEMFEASDAMIPPYRMLNMPIKSALLDLPGIQINGFQFSFSAMMSPQFLVTQEVCMAPKKSGRGDMGPIPEAYIGGKLPFYGFAAQYHHADFTPTGQKHNFSLIGRIDSHGQVQAIFFKPLTKRSHVRFTGAFPNSNPDLAQYESELETQIGSARYAFSANSEALETSLVQKLGSKLLVATQLTYVHMTRTLANSFLFRFSRTPYEKYYAQFSETSRSGSFSLWSRLDDKTSIVTDLQISGDSFESSAGLGYKRRSKNFEVTSSIRTNGDMKSLFSYSMQAAFKLKLFLGGNLFQDDFKTGYSISVGGGDD